MVTLVLNLVLALVLVWASLARLVWSSFAWFTTLNIIMAWYDGT